MAAFLKTDRWIAQLGRTSRHRRATAPRRQLRLGLEPLEQRQLLAVGDALSLNGTNQYLYAPTPPPPTAPAVPGEMTVEAWIRVSDNTPSTANQTIVATDNSQGFRLMLFDEGPTTRVFFRASPFGNLAVGATSIPNNTWTHVAGVFSPTTGTVSVYVNGLLDASVSDNVGGTWGQWISIGGGYAGSPSLTPLSPFKGSISEVRLWTEARTSDELRRSMHDSLRERLPYLAADWALSTDFSELVTGQTATALGGPTIVPAGAPPVPPSVPLDSSSTSLPYHLGYPVSAYLPESNELLLTGGYNAQWGYLPYSFVLDLGTGAARGLASLDETLIFGAGAYSAARRTVYVFGGLESQESTPHFRTSPLAIDPQTGASRDVGAANLAVYQPLAIGDPSTGRILVLGGYGPDLLAARTSLVFDPASETFLPLTGFQVPNRSQMAGVRSSQTGKVYLFGGNLGGQFGGPTATIDEISVNTATGQGSVSTLAVQLPQAASDLQAVEDPVSGLIYLFGDTGAGPWVFDPLTGQIWTTPVAYPRTSSGVPREKLFGATAVFDPRQRQAWLLGGWDSQASIYDDDIWRLPLGSGAAVPLERWDFYRPFGAGGAISGIAGDDSRVVVSDGVYPGALRVFEGLSPPGTLSDPLAAAGLGSLGLVNGVGYYAGNRSVWPTTDSQGTFQITPPPNALAFQYATPSLPSNQVNAVDGLTTAIGTDRGLSVPNLTGTRTTLYGDRSIQDIATNSVAGEIWSVSTVGTGGPTNQLERTIRNPNFTYSTTTFANPANYFSSTQSITDLAFDDENHLFLAGQGYFSQSQPTNIVRPGVLYVPDRNNPDAAFALPSSIGLTARDLSTDAEGRVWAAMESIAVRIIDRPSPIFSLSGGLTAYEAVGAGVRDTQYNWLNAPLGSRTTLDPFVPLWDSTVTRVEGVDEKVWIAQPGGGIVTLAQRWEQLDQNNALDQQSLDGVWTARGRTFFASAAGTFVLQPDGVTWDNRPGVHARAVLGDSRGRIWVGTDTGVRRYTPTGWDLLGGKLGIKPSAPVRALAEDNAGRIWIGGDGGLTLYDRDRFVATFTAQNSLLPATRVNSLLVDRQNQLWIGTEAGLVRWNLNSTEGMRRYTTAQGLPSNAIFDLAQLGTGQIAVSTAAGLVIWNGTSFVLDQPREGAANLPLAVDELGRLWAGGAVRTGSGWDNYYWTNSGLRSSQVVDIATDGADRVWFVHGSDGGASVRGTYLPPLRDAIPIITGLGSRFGSGGDLLAIQGSGFGTDPGDLIVSIGGWRVPVQTVTDTELLVLIQDDTGTGEIAVTRGQRTAEFLQGDLLPDFMAKPRIDSFTPDAASAGVLMQIKGANFDPGARVQIGNGPLRTPRLVQPTLIELLVSADEADGLVRVLNPLYTSVGDSVTDTSDTPFRQIAVSVSNIVLTQGLDAYGLVATKPTLASGHLRAETTAGTIELDEVEVRFLHNGNYAGGGRIPLAPGIRPPVSESAPSAAMLGDITNGVVAKNLLPLAAGTNQVEMIFRRNGVEVARGTRQAELAAPGLAKVLLIPVMKRANTESGYSVTDLIQMQQIVDNNTSELVQRMVPTARVDLRWAPHVLVEDDPTLDLGDVVQLFQYGQEFDEVRDWWNRNHPDDQRDIAFGIVDPALRSTVPGKITDGQAFWPDLSAEVNALTDVLPIVSGVKSLAELGCNVISEISEFFGGDEMNCDLDIPLFVGWSFPYTSGSGGYNPTTGAANSSLLIGHELGHILGLVKPYSPNGNANDNLSHSIYDELDGGTRNDPAATYNPNRTFYDSPGVNGIVANPITGTQFFENAERESYPRAKAIMAYAKAMTNENSFFEPVDLLAMRAETHFTLFRTLVDLAIASVAETAELGPDGAPGGQQAPAAQTATTPTAVVVRGFVDPEAGTGEISRVSAALGREVESASFASGYWLVQLDSSGQELSRTGVRLVRAAEEDDEHGASPLRAYAAALPAQPGLSRVELRHETTVLDSFAAGGAAPVVSFVQSPGGNTYAVGTVGVAWQASDADGDAVRVRLDYSADGGNTWDSLYTSTGAGSYAIPVELLPGGQGLVRLSASDGLHYQELVSLPLFILPRAPTVIIESLGPAVTVLEGEPISLRARVRNSQGPLDSAQLQWTSDRDGELGTGSGLYAQLSAGTHLLTASITNGYGLVGSTSVTVEVLPDYDFDGLADTDEAALGTLLLAPENAFSDEDGDGLFYRNELARGLNPNLADSDGDGQTDPAEIAAGTDPGAPNAPVTVDPLVVGPSSVDLTVDFAQRTVVPQQVIGVLTRTPVQWQATSGADWLSLSNSEGTTPAAVRFYVSGESLAEGTHQTSLVFRTADGTQTAEVLVRVTIQNRMALFDVDRDGDVDQADRQQVFTRQGQQFGQVGYDYGADLNRDGIIDPLDLAAVNPVVPGLVGDANGDCIVGAADYAILASQFGQTGFGLAADFDGNGSVGAGDYSLWAANFGAMCPPLILIGDANHDGFVGAADYAILASQFNLSGPNLAADFDGNGTVGAGDYSLWAANFGRSLGGAALAAPAATQARLGDRVSPPSAATEQPPSTVSVSQRFEQAWNRARAADRVLDHVQAWQPAAPGQVVLAAARGSASTSLWDRVLGKVTGERSRATG